MTIHERMLLSINHVDLCFYHDMTNIKSERVMCVTCKTICFVMCACFVGQSNYHSIIIIMIISQISDNEISWVINFMVHYFGMYAHMVQRCTKMLCQLYA